MTEEYTVQVSARVTPAEREAILAHGGLAYMVRKFLKDNAAGGEEKLIGGMRVLDAQKRELSEDRKRLEKEIKDLDAQQIKIDIAIVGIETHLQVFKSEAQKKGDERRARGDKDLLLSKRLKGLQKAKSPKEWEKDNKLILLLQHSATESLKQADIERVVQKMRIEPDKVIAWLYQPSPEHISPEKLNKIRCNAWGSLPSLQDLQKEGKVNENFYVLLMKWLGLQTKEEVDIWIMHGLEEQSGPIDPSCRPSAHNQPAATTELEACHDGGS